MKSRLLIIIGIVIISIIGVVSILNSQEIMLSTGMMTSTDCRYDELRHNDKCLKIEIPKHLGSWVYGIDSIIAYNESLPTPPDDPDCPRRRP